MAYCRVNEDSDVYMYPTMDNSIVCCDCLLKNIDGTEFIFRRDALLHLNPHKTWGHKVPDYAFERLEHEILTEGNEVSS